MLDTALGYVLSAHRTRIERQSVTQALGAGNLLREGQEDQHCLNSLKGSRDRCLPRLCGTGERFALEDLSQSKPQAGRKRCTQMPGKRR